MGVEIYVAHSAFPLSVEVESDKVSVGVDGRRSRITTCSVVGGGKGYGYFALRIDVSSEVAFMVKVEQFFRYIKLIIVRYIFLYNPIESGLVFIFNSIGRLRAAYLPIRYSQSEIGVGKKDLVFVGGHLQSHIAFLQIVETILYLLVVVKAIIVIDLEETTIHIDKLVVTYLGNESAIVAEKSV